MARKLEQVKQKGLDTAEWKRLHDRYQQEYKRRRLRAIKAAMEHSSLRGLARALDCSSTTLSGWFSIYLQEGLAGLVADIRHRKPERLTQEQKRQLAQWLEEKQPADFGLEEAYIWTGKRVAALVEQQFGVSYQPIGIYNLLERMGFSHQRAHRDYGNAKKEEQQAFVEAFKKSADPAAGGADYLL